MNLKLKNLALFLTLIFTSNAFAEVAWNTYSEKAVEEAAKAGKTVLLGFHKKGCGTCETQDEALEKAGLSKLNVEALKVEYKNSDMASVYKKYGFNDRQWSALVLLKNGKEVGRINPGTTDEKQIADLLLKAK